MAWLAIATAGVTSTEVLIKSLLLVAKSWNLVTMGRTLVKLGQVCLRQFGEGFVWFYRCGACMDASVHTHQVAGVYNNAQADPVLSLAALGIYIRLYITPRSRIGTR